MKENCTFKICWLHQKKKGQDLEPHHHIYIGGNYLQLMKFSQRKDKQSNKSGLKR